MPTDKPHPDLATCLDLWNLLMILAGVAAVLLLRPFTPGP
jgi:hypothetical protein